jgi:hypothetical protein
MLILGHKFIPSESLFHTPNIDSISNTPPSSIIYLEFSEENLDIINHANSNQVSFALSIKNITELIYASALGAKYILVSHEMAKTAQNIAENYLFDSKILVNIKSEEEIEEIALLGCDGVIFSNAIIKTNS